ncbi:MAG: hypothetical protein HQL75_00480 [Magnetococcales bacterium]|nr:hypothetical protein [Magnetococcales bacterium]
MTEKLPSTALMERTNTGTPPEIRLWQNVFLMGLRDLYRISENPHPGDARWRSSALELTAWATDQSGKIGSMLWICWIIEINHQKVLEKLMGTLKFMKRILKVPKGDLEIFNMERLESEPEMDYNRHSLK